MATQQLSGSGITAYSKEEELLSAGSHAVGLILACIGLLLMLQQAGSLAHALIAGIYGSSLILMYLTSTCYHSIHRVNWKRSLKLLDHSAIYLLIAGTYIPFLLISIGGWLGTASAAVIGSIAAFGVGFKCVAGHRFPKIALATYLVMGWLALTLIYPLYQALPAPALWLLVAGGVCFSVGAAFYMAKHIKYTHFVWHLFVLAGTACHFLSIYLYVI